MSEEEILIVREASELPKWADRDTLVHFFHETMKPWNDSLEDCNKALDYAFSDAEGKGGFLTLIGIDGKLAGAVLMQNTGMEGYIPENILLMVSVDPDRRGQGIGQRIIEKALEAADGDVKLHVEYENPARRLYERVGFTSKYAEMRWTPNDD